MSVVPKHARVVVVGGGIIGTSVAYHLAEMGWTDIVLLERDRLTSGTTWHAAGLMVTFGSTSETSTSMRRYTRDLYARLEAETGLSTGFKPVGFIEVAADNDRLEEYRRISAFNRHCGVDVHEISPAQVKELFPLAKVDDLRAGFYVPGDGVANPVDVTMAMAKGARMRGVLVLEGVACTGVRRRVGHAGNAVAGIDTTAGPIDAEYVVNCGGMWARQIGEKAGVNIPLQSAEHYYLITDKIPGIGDWPVLEDPASYGYFRREVDGLMVGLFEPVCAPWKIEGVPEDFSFGEITPDWERMGPYVERAMSRVPATLEVGIKKLFCGPESFTPDLQPIVGEAPELKNYFVAAGMNSIGILTGGGLGRALAHWIVTGTPDVDVTGFNIDRLHRYQTNPDYRRTRTVESLGMVYQCHYPFRSMQTARDAKRSPLHDRLAARGARFRDVSGWEGVDYYGAEALEEGPLSWGKPSWFSQWATEHRAAREGVILMDMSFMSKFLVQGRDAGKSLDALSTARVDGAPGRTTYTQWLDASAKLQADLTVTKLDDQKFMVVATDTAHRHVETWMRRHFPEDAHVVVTDVTGALAQINLQGPRSRELLQALTTADLANEAFAFRDAKELAIGFARVVAVRITYLGELGWELYVPTEQAVHVYDRIVAAGEAVGLVHAGLKALASLRMEKGYRDYGHDIDNTDTILEAGLAFTVDAGKDFRGADALRALRLLPLKRRLVQVLITDPGPLLFHAEIVYRDGHAVGYIRAASYGHTLGGAVGLAMVEADVPLDAAWLAAGTWEVDIAGTRHAATASLRPLYDPKSERVRS